MKNGRIINVKPCDVKVVSVDSENIEGLSVDSVNREGQVSMRKAYSNVVEQVMRKVEDGSRFVYYCEELNLMGCES